MKLARLRIPLLALSLIFGLVGCQDAMSRRPYLAQRPAYNTNVINPMKIGGYAGYNYGPPSPVDPELGIRRGR